MNQVVRLLGTVVVVLPSWRETGAWVNAADPKAIRAGVGSALVLLAASLAACDASAPQATPPARLDVEYGPEGLVVESAGFERFEGAEGPVHVRISAPEAAVGFDVHASSLREAAQVLRQEVDKAYNELVVAMEEGSLIGPEQMAALSPEERDEVRSMLARAGQAMLALPSVDELRDMSPQQREARIEAVQALLRGGIKQ